jgi:squalene synthase HpnC
VEKRVGVGHYENFPVASIVLPARLRRPVIAIYRFARAADDIADEGNATPHERLEQLVEFSRHLDRVARGERLNHPAFGELTDVIAAFQLPMTPFHDLLSAFSQDVVKSRYADFAEVLDYCRRSANPVGRLLLHLFGATAPRDLEQSDAVCSALQLLNFWQDIAIDLRKDRVYLPQDAMTRWGVSEADLASGDASPSFCRLMAEQIERGRAMLESGAPLAGRLPGRIGLELQLIIEGGRTIARKLHETNERGERGRPTVRSYDWMMMLARASIRRLRNRIAR